MYTLQDLREWARDIGKFASDENIEVHEGNFFPTELDIEIKEDTLRFSIYTNENKYTIVGSISKNDRDPEPGENYVPVWRTYLGCTADSRKPRAGETWTRGSDLSDGELSLTTWNRILGDIISYELVRVHQQHKNEKVRVVANKRRRAE